jgi:hypothetical protein
MKSQKRVQSPACLSIISGRGGVEVVAAALSPTVGVVDDWDCVAVLDCCVTFGWGGCELLVVGIFGGKSIFCLSLTQTFLCVKFRWSKTMKEKEHMHWPGAHGTSTTARLRHCNSVPSPLGVRGFKRFQAQLSGEDSAILWLPEGLWWNKRARNVLRAETETT